jgi:5-oxopent-3-ene-1,2,5-tricarboxylate decarboxylase/2-hydroxyhepta-2,4-diene-1,7-dioate isomerase
LSGTVVGALLNDAATLAALGDAVHQPPHKAPPRAPVLQVKPRNTLAGPGAQVAVPAGVDALEVGASLGLVMARATCRVAESDALACVAGLTLVADLRVPHDHSTGHYRPAVRERARDGFCPIGPVVVPLSAVANVDDLTVTVAVDGQVVQRASTGGRVRGTARLISDVSDFMTLQPGDILMPGPAHGAPLARVGQQVAITVEGIGTLAFTLVAEGEGAAA